MRDLSVLFNVIAMVTACAASRSDDFADFQTWVCMSIVSVATALAFDRGYHIRKENSKEFTP